MVLLRYLSFCQSSPSFASLFVGRFLAFWGLSLGLGSASQRNAGEETYFFLSRSYIDDAVTAGRMASNDRQRLNFRCVWPLEHHQRLTIASVTENGLLGSSPANQFSRVYLLALTPVTNFSLKNLRRGTSDIGKICCFKVRWKLL